MTDANYAAGGPGSPTPRNPARPAAAPLATGICSVTFRQLDVPTVIGLVADAGLGAVEWGGDVHVPVGDPAAAEQTRARSERAGIGISSYGSYYRGGTAEEFAPVVRSAAALGAPGIRVWAGEQGSAGTAPAERARLAGELARAADLAAEQGIAVGLEYHRNTLTDTLDSTLRLLAEVDALRPGAELPLSTYWQPRNGIGPDEALAELDALGARLTTAHVFSWAPDGTRLPLSDRAELWTAVLGRLAERGLGHYALLEFVAEDSPQNFRADAAALRGWAETAG